MTTTPSRPATAWPGLHTVPTGLKADVSARIARQLFRAAVTPPAGVRPRRHAPCTASAGPSMVLHRPEEFYARIGRDGLIGFGESYLTGAWDAEDLGGFLTVLAAELPNLIPAPLQKLRAAYVRRPPRAHQNTEDNAQGNIAHHYDLSNDLFAAVPRRDAELLLRALRHLGRRPRRPPRGRAARGPRPRAARRGAGAQDRPAARPDRRRRGHPRARDRHRLGRARHPGGPPRRDRALGDALQASSSTWPSSASPRPGSPTG